MKKNEIKTPPVTCADCIHEHACQAWNVGTIHNMNAATCINHETVKESAAYYLGYRDGAWGISQ